MIVRQKWSAIYPVHKTKSIPNIQLAVEGNKTYNASCGLASTGAATTCITRQQTEAITYTGGMPGHTRQGANLCIHNKYLRRYTGNVLAPSMTQSLKSNPCVHTDYFHLHQSAAESDHSISETEAYAAFGSLTGVALLNSNAQAYANQTYLALKPDLNTFSLPNTLIDVKQFGDLFKLWNKASGLVTNLASARLNQKFGWLPTIGDLKDLGDIVLQLRGKLDKFKYSKGTIISSRKRLLKESIVKLGNVTLSANVRRVWRGQLDHQVHGYLVYKPLPMLVLGQLDEQLRAILSATGFELNPKIVWDAIPLSFVVDWFVNVGDWLGTFKTSALELPISILQVFMQNKERIQVDSWYEWNDDINYSFRPGTGPGTVSVAETFHRLPYWPDLATFALLKAKLPSPSQAINLVALGTVLNARKIKTFERSLIKIENNVLNNLTVPKLHIPTYFDYDNPIF